MRILSGLQERMRRRFTPAGQILLVATFTAGLFGADTRQSMAHQAFSLGLVLLLLAWLGSLRRPSGLTVQRSLPRYATVGEACTYRVELANSGTQIQQNLHVAEGLPDPRPDRAVFLRARAPREAQVSPVDRLFGYPRWNWLVNQARWAEPPASVPVAGLAKGEKTEFRLSLSPRRRGVLRLQGLRVSRSEILGLGRSMLTLTTRDRLLVLPKRYPVPKTPLPGHRRLQPGGVSLASSVGDSREFMGLRDYRPGDSPRHIHWPAWARSGKPVVKEYQDEYFSRQALILDSFVGPGREPAFEAAVSVAASLVEPLQGTDTLLDLMFVADRAHTLTAGRGLMSGNALLETLACVQPAEGVFEQMSRAVLSHAPLLGAALCVFLEWDPPRRDLAGRLRALGLPLKILVIDGTGEAEPGLMFLDSAYLERGLAEL